MTGKEKREKAQHGKSEEPRDELKRLRERVYEDRDIPEIAGEALRKARARAEEYRSAFGVAADELARTRSLLQEAWRAPTDLEYSASAYSIDSERGRDFPAPARERADGRGKTDAGSERGACPACGGLASHSPACPLARALDLLRDPRPRRYELEDAVDREWFARTGERDGVRSRLTFLDTVFGELAKWGLIRED